MSSSRSKEFQSFEVSTNLISSNILSLLYILNFIFYNVGTFIQNDIKKIAGTKNGSQVIRSSRCQETLSRTFYKRIWLVTAKSKKIET